MIYLSFGSGLFVNFMIFTINSRQKSVFFTKNKCINIIAIYTEMKLCKLDKPRIVAEVAGI